jgi:hypothetical protein
MFVVAINVFDTHIKASRIAPGLLRWGSTFSQREKVAAQQPDEGFLSKDLRA